MKWSEKDVRTRHKGLHQQRHQLGASSTKGTAQNSKNILQFEPGSKFYFKSSAFSGWGNFWFDMSLVAKRWQC